MKLIERLIFIILVSAILTINLTNRKFPKREDNYCWKHPERVQGIIEGVYFNCPDACLLPPNKIYCTSFHSKIAQIKKEDMVILNKNN